MLLVFVEYVWNFRCYHMLVLHDIHYSNHYPLVQKQLKVHAQYSRHQTEWGCANAVILQHSLHLFTRKPDLQNTCLGTIVADWNTGQLTKQVTLPYLTGVMVDWSVPVSQTQRDSTTSIWYHRMRQSMCLSSLRSYARHAVERYLPTKRKLTVTMLSFRGR